MRDITKHSDEVIDSLLPEEKDEVRLQKFEPHAVWDDSMQEVNLTFGLTDLLRAAVRKLDAETGRRKAPAVMLALPAEVQTLQYVANGNLYEIRLSLGRQNAGAYMTVVPRKLGKLAEEVIANEPFMVQA